MEALTAAAFLSGLVGYAIGKDGQLQPVSQEQVNKLLQDQKPEFIRDVDIDSTVARDGGETSGKYEEAGSYILVRNPSGVTGTTIYLRLNEPNWPKIPISGSNCVRRITGPFYRFFIENEAGTGTLNLLISKGYQFQFVEGVVDSTLTMEINDLTNVSAASPSDDELLIYDSSTSYWTSAAITTIAAFASHKARHQDGGTDELNIAGLAGEPAELGTHKLVKAANATLGHVIVETGSDIDVDAEGKLTLGLHASRHNLAGDDEIVLDGLSGTPIQLTAHADLTTGTHGVTGTILGTEDVDDTPINGATTAPVSSNWAYDHVAASDPHTGYVLESLFDAYTILYADTDNTPVALSVAASRLIGRKATGGIAALAKADILTLINVADGADVTADNAPQAHKTSHQDGGSDEISIAGLAGNPANRGAANGLASLDASSKVTEQPASITDHLEGTPTEDLATKAPTSEWAFDHNAASTGVHGAGANTLLNTGDVDDTPVNGATTAPISSNWAYDHVAAADPHGGYVLESLFDAYTILYADTDNTPAALSIAASRIVGRKATGGIVALTGAEVLTICGVTATAAELNVLDGIPGTLTATELGYVDGVTSGIQTQLNGKASTSHKDTHDPNDGSDPLDTATASTQAFGDSATEGTAHSLARSDHKHGMPANPATKEFFAPVTYTNGGGLSGIQRYAGAQLENVNEQVKITFHVPADFTSISEAVILCAWDATHANTNLDIYSHYATAGEACTANAEDDTTSTYSFTANELKEIDISGILSSLAADDYVGIVLKMAADPGDMLIVLGIRFKYA